MDRLIETLISNKILLTLAVMASIVIIVSAAKKLLKIAVVCIALLVVYAGYLAYTGQKVPRTKDEILRHGEKKIELLEKKRQRHFMKKAG